MQYNFLCNEKLMHSNYRHKTQMDNLLPLLLLKSIARCKEIRLAGALLHHGP